jgi:hypothetical protein
MENGRVTAAHGADGSQTSAAVFQLVLSMAADDLMSDPVLEEFNEMLDETD